MEQEDNVALKVLIADDALFMRNLLKDILEKSGFEVVAEATNGKEAVDLYREHNPDLVTMDIVMPLKSGIEALEEIIKENPEARVVMCSALGQESLVLEAVQCGAKDFIVKPFKEERVVEVVSRICEQNQ